jgi:hypothetical protein
VAGESGDVSVSAEIQGVLVARRLGVPAIVLAVGLLLGGCGGSGTNDGSMPTPAGDDGPTGTSPTPTSSASSAKPTKPAPPSAVKLIIQPGSFGANPAVQGYRKVYPLYYLALAQRDTKIVERNFPAYFLSDVAPLIATAKSRGWIMRPPGSVVVVGVEQRPFDIVRIRSCRSQTAGFWDPSTRKWVQSAPKGVPETVDMVKRGDGWTMYRWYQPVPKPFSCAAVRYPA